MNRTKQIAIGIIYFLLISIFSSYIDFPFNTITATNILGTIAGSITDTHEWDAQEGRNYGENGVVRVNTSEYYLVVAAGDTGTDYDGFARTLKVYNNNGTIVHGAVSSYEYDTSDGYSANVRQISGTDKYVIAYEDEGGLKVTLVVLQVWANNGTIKQAAIDSQQCSYIGWMSSGYYGSLSLLSVYQNVFCVAYTDGGSSDGFMETWWISNSGIINNTQLDIEEFDTTYGVMPSLCLVDTNTIAMTYQSGSSTGDYTLMTYNITTNGLITDTPSDSWVYIPDPKLQGGNSKIDKVGTNTYELTFVNGTYRIYTKTVTIDTAGKITKSFIDSLLLYTTATSTPSFLYTFFVIDPKVDPGGNGVIGLTFSNDTTNAVGWVYTWNVSSIGNIGSTIIDSLLFSTETAFFSDVTYVNNNIYLIVYTGGSLDGWSATVSITTSLDTATTYYVSSSGDDGNNGTTTLSPWKTVAKVNTEMNGGVVGLGDDVYFKRGDTFTDAYLNVKTGGNSTNRMIIGAYGTGNKPILDSTGLDYNIYFGTNGIGNITIQNFTLKNSVSDSMMVTAYVSNITISSVNVTDSGHNGIFVDDTIGLKIENCVVHDCANTNICLYGSPSHRLSNTQVLNCTAYNSGIGEDNIQLHMDDVNNNAGNNHLFRNCTSYDSGEDGFDITAGNNIIVEDCETYGNPNCGLMQGHNASNLTVQDCCFHNDKYGIVVGVGNNIIIRNNVIFNTTNSMFCFEPTSFKLRNCTVYNNDFVQPSGCIYTNRLMNFDYDYYKSIMLKNNIIATFDTTNPTAFLRVYGGATIPPDTNVTFDTNMWYHGSGNAAGQWWYNGSSNMILTQWKNYYSTDTFDNPEFVNANANNLILNSTSPCIDTGDFLTQTNGAGVGSSTVIVDEANYFTDGHGMQSGDVIVIGNNNPVRILSIVYPTKTITINTSINWNDHDNISLRYTGAAPNIGALETYYPSAPTQSTPFPVNGSISVGLSPADFQITVYDANHEKMDITWKENHTTGAWRTFAISTDVLNGIISVTNTSWVAHYGTSYWWKVYVQDSYGLWKNATYHFMTLTNAPSLTSTPTNGSLNIALTPKCNITAVNIGLRITVRFYSNTTGGWMLRQTNQSIVSGATARWIYTNVTTYGKTYWWRVVTNNSDTPNEWSNVTYNFMTNTNLPPILTEAPANGSWNQSASHTCAVTATDPNGDKITIKFYENTTGVWKLQQTNLTITSGAIARWMYDNATNWNTRYWWKVVTNDTGTPNGWMNKTYHFDVLANRSTIIVSVSPANSSTGVLLSTTNINALINDPEGDTISWIINAPGLGLNGSIGETNGTKVCNITGLVAGTTYYWTVSSIDSISGIWTNATYHFRTVLAGGATVPYYMFVVTARYKSNHSVIPDAIVSFGGTIFVSNNQGIAIFWKPAGQYRLIAGKSGYGAVTQDVVLSADQSLTVDLGLNPTGIAALPDSQALGMFIFAVFVCFSVFWLKKNRRKKA